MLWKGLIALSSVGLAAGLSYATFAANNSDASLGFAGPALVGALDWADGAIDSLREGVAPGETRADPEAAAALDAAVRRGLATPAEPEAEITAAAEAACAATGSTADGVVLGDRIALRFFERDAAAEGAATVHFERLDLSGAYEVDPTGALSIPLIGRVPVEERSLACVEAMIADRYRATFLVDASVSAAFAARPPVLVSGAVRAPGSYALSAATSLRHVAAMAGAGAAATGQDPARAALLGRRAELQRLRAELELRDLAVAAEREGRAGFDPAAEPARGLAAALGPARVAAEAAGLGARAEARAREDAARRDRVETATRRIALMETERLRLERQLADRRERLAKLRGLSDRGIAPLSSLAADETALISLERAAFDLIVERAAAEAELRAAELALAALPAERAEALAAEAETIAEAIGGIDAQIASVELQLDALVDGMRADGGGALKFRVTRRSAAGERSFEGGLGATIRPGDLVEVAPDANRLTELR